MMCFKLTMLSFSESISPWMLLQKLAITNYGTSIVVPVYMARFKLHLSMWAGRYRELSLNIFYLLFAI